MSRLDEPPHADTAAGDPPKADESLLGRAFDGYQNMMQIARCIREAARQRGVAQPRVLELSRRATGLGDYLPETAVTRFATHEANRPTLTMPVVLPFADKSWDACIVSDVYEHIPEEMRRSLLGEMIRVTRGLVLVGCPQENEIVTRFDSIVFDFIWGKYGEKFEPLAQHHDFGLDALGKIESSFTELGADKVASLPCNYVYRWIHQILIYFDLQHRHPHWDLFQPLNRIYNEHLAPYDYREPSYRCLIVAATDPGLDMEAFLRVMQSPAEPPARAAQTEGMLLDAFRGIDSRLADKLRAYTAEVERLNGIIAELQRDNQWALGEIGKREEQSREQSEQEDILRTRDEDIARLREELAALRNTAAEKVELERILRARDEGIYYLQSEVSARSGRITALEEVLRKMEEARRKMEASPYWHLRSVVRQPRKALRNLLFRQKGGGSNETGPSPAQKEQTAARLAPGRKPPPPSTEAAAPVVERAPEPRGFEELVILPALGEEDRQRVLNQQIEAAPQRRADIISFSIIDW